METDYIYSSVPEEAMEIQDPERQLILEFLEKNAGKFYTARQIAKEVGLPVRGTQVEVRKAITMLIEIDMKPIMSNAKGFALVDQSNQMYFYARQLEERMLGIQRRIKKVREIAVRMECDGQ